MAPGCHCSGRGAIAGRGEGRTNFRGADVVPLLGAGGAEGGDD